MAETSESEIPMKTLRVLAERAGLHLSDEELAEVGRYHNLAGADLLRELDYEDVSPAVIFTPGQV